VLIGKAISKIDSDQIMFGHHFVVRHCAALLASSGVSAEYKQELYTKAFIAL
jgi:hypothetical protein